MPFLKKARPACAAGLFLLAHINLKGIFCADISVVLRSIFTSIIYAARAGEQGRGFAVVAAEVRTLAQRAASAAREIKELIGASVEQVEAGDRLVADAGATMQDIVASVSRVTDIMREMQAAGDEQSAGIAQVGAAIAHMDAAVQSNAALEEQASASANTLEHEAAELSRTVQFFTLASQVQGQDHGALHAVQGGASRRQPVAEVRRLVA